jgi:hypothetical protein
MASLGSLANSPILGILQMLIGIAEQKRSQGQYTGDVDEQIRQLYDVANRMGPETLKTYDQPAGMALDELTGLRDRQRAAASTLYDETGESRSDFLSGFGRRGDELVGGYEDRYARAESDLAGYGRQQAEDIDAASKQREAQSVQQLMDRGMYGSTIAPTLGLATERERSAEQRRLGEDLTRMRLDILPRLSGDALTARGGLDRELAVYDSAMRGDVLNARRYMSDVDATTTGNVANWFGNNAVNRSNIVNAGFGSQYDAIMGVNRVPPPALNFSQIGANAVQPVQPPGFSASSLIGPSIGAGGMITAASIIATAVICIDGESRIATADGSTLLKNVRVGDRVRSAHGGCREVVAKHLRQYTGDDSWYIRLTMNGRFIIISRDHPIEGRPAGEWIGEPGVEWKSAVPKVAGDLLLDDGSGYIANGFVISSLIHHSDMDALTVLEPENQVPVGA